MPFEGSRGKTLAAFFFLPALSPHAAVPAGAAGRAVLSSLV